jgi:hypothetical protein
MPCALIEEGDYPAVLTSSTLSMSLTKLKGLELSMRVRV